MRKQYTSNIRLFEKVAASMKTSRKEKRISSRIQVELYCVLHNSRSGEIRKLNDSQHLDRRQAVLSITCYVTR
jgi:hypothetical protein